MYLGKEYPKFFPAGPFFSVFSLSKCPYFKKPPLPSEIPGYAPVLQNNIKTAAARRYHEGKWICKLKTLAPHGLNTEIGDYAK